ncbi:hypothetical protein [Arsenicicoccus dermatophilus]|uniref:hypothetical protein n=1 Tax=Arsenicicoccus dermatophilus TaxID=1076331 RepID=UPI001F4D2EC3|nr:hypothetical protein [Arsenicicoccus dermatophilus]MCH8613563.1 hypothetical protein [Arsenicicoccus dermatophilus]
MTTKTKTKTDPIAEARAKVADLTTKRDDAELAAEALDARLASGDETVTAAEMVQARTEVERLTTLLTAAERAHERAVQSAPFDGPIPLAEAVADLLRTAWDGLQVETTRERPAVPAEAPTVPVAYVVQDKPCAQDLQEGCVSGSVRVIIHRGAFHATLDLDPRLDDTAADCQARTTSYAQGERVEGATTVSEWRVDVARAWEALPVITATPEDWMAQYGLLGLTRAVEALGRPTGMMTSFVRDVREVPTGEVEITETDGVRTITRQVMVNAILSADHPFMDSAAFVKAIGRAAEDTIGEVRTYHGRITEAALVRSDVRPGTVITGRTVSSTNDRDVAVLITYTMQARTTAA